MMASSPERTLSAGRCGGEDRQLSGESALVIGPRFAASNVGGKIRIFVQHTRRFQPEQHRHHHQVARAELAFEPVGIAEATGKLAQPVTARSSTRGMRCADQGLSPSRSLAVQSSRMGGSTVLSAANIHAIARARAFASSGSRPA